ncbi:MAG: CHAT domain-containing tetratricopeptide repeat protein [Reichenbachiella sp.]|uniref:CHAT domain-containing protein n=1 Tax=Reichenbachiella sp. TaxID=2184521 RepID=UPI00326550D8
MKSTLSTLIITIVLSHTTFGQTLDELSEKVMESYSKGDYENALYYGEKSVAQVEKEFGKEHEDYPIAVRNLALFNRLLGHYADAESLYQESIQIIKERLGENHLNYAVSVNGLAILYQEMGRYIEAETLYKKSSEIRIKLLGKNHLGYAKSLNSLATLYLKMKRYKESEGLHLKSIEIKKNILSEDDLSYAFSIINLGYLYQLMGHYEKAEKMLKQGLEIRKKSLGTNHNLYAVSQNNLALLYRETGRYTEAEVLYKESIKIFKDQLGKKHSRHTTAQVNLVMLYQGIGDLSKAEPLFLEAIDNRLNQMDLNFPSMSEKEKRQFWKTITNDFQLFNSFVAETIENEHVKNLTGQMYNNQLAIKGILLNEISKIKKAVTHSEDTALINLYNEWKTKRDNLSRAYSLSIKQREQQNINIPEIQQSINNLEKKLSLKSKAFANANKRFTWKEVQRQLKPKEAAIEIVRFRWYNKNWTDTVYYAALIVTPEIADQPEMVLLENGNELENNCLNYYRNSLKKLSVDEQSYIHYWQPIQDKLEGIKKVYFSADGVYNLINLNTLLKPQLNTYVLDEIDIQLVTTTKDIVEFASSPSAVPKSSLTAHLFGNPSYNLAYDQYQQVMDVNKNTSRTRGIESFDETLPLGEFIPLARTEQEINNIHQLLRTNDWKTTTYLGTEALEERVKELNSPTLLHIATHGYFKSVENKNGVEIKGNSDESSMLNSGLILAGVTNYYESEEKPLIEDGILTAYESTTLNLDSTELVVLSACDTGLGELSHGEGVYGLQRGLKVAGANSVMMSLWKVNDEITQELMTQFYKEWLKNGDKLKAFRVAQQKIKNKHPHPYYWGVFVLVGDNTLIETEARINGVIFSLAGSFIVILVGFAVQKFRNNQFS